MVELKSGHWASDSVSFLPCLRSQKPLDELSVQLSLSWQGERDRANERQGENEREHGRASEQEPARTSKIGRERERAMGACYAAASSALFLSVTADKMIVGMRYKSAACHHSDNSVSRAPLPHAHTITQRHACSLHTHSLPHKHTHWCVAEYIVWLAPQGFRAIVAGD